MTASDVPKPSQVDISGIAGNVSTEIKEFITYMFIDRGDHPPVFGRSILDRMRTTDIWVQQKPEEPMKVEAKVIIEMVVGEDMLNGGGNMHGGCAAFLVDVCSTLALTALGMAQTGTVQGTVSQSLNLIYHSPAAPGDQLKIVNTTLTMGSRVVSARTEIWNATHHRLAVSGTHIKMAPTPSIAKL
ncbi:HotDog domain-containing protein [Crepidotus variabilis]|uniref:HotDog domain-containing protein n=1 Tax=Crepidotus variabilis TaxID=179855 RepID=A0A9P6EFC5_9AGAR|nr:HotDog domain-containing protein [Crepidotus variabilis]